MSDYTPKNGEQVRVVLEGKFRGHPTETGIWYIGGPLEATIYPDGHQSVVVSVEKLTDPIPTPVGTVLWIDGDAYQCEPNGTWSVTGLTRRYSDADMQTLADHNGFTVLREGQG